MLKVDGANEKVLGCPGQAGENVIIFVTGKS